MDICDFQEIAMFYLSWQIVCKYSLILLMSEETVVLCFVWYPILNSFIKT